MEPGSSLNHPAIHSAMGATLLASLVGWLPPVAALIAIVFYLIEMIESKLVQTWWRWYRRRSARHRRAKK